MFHVSRISLAFLPCCPSSHEMTHFSGAHFLARLASSAASASSTLPSLLTSRTSEPFGFLEKKVRVISFRPINRDERCEKKGGRRQRSCVFWIFSASSRREVWCGLKFTSGDRGTRRKHARGRRGGLGVQDYWSYLLQSAGNSTGDSRRSFLGGLCHCVHSTRDRVLHGTRNATRDATRGVRDFAGATRDFLRHRPRGVLRQFLRSRRLVLASHVQRTKWTVRSRVVLCGAKQSNDASTGRIVTQSPRRLGPSETNKTLSSSFGRVSFFIFGKEVLTFFLSSPYSALSYSHRSRLP